jgi:two-component system, NarL family, invasion response regulator UvrY
MEQIIRLAIADDHEIVRKGVKEIILAFGGYNFIIEASNGKELYEQLLAAETLPDIVIMDISMPEWDGYETLEAIRKKWPELRVLVLTMHKHEFAIIKMFRTGANGYILKNCPPKELHGALQSIAETGFYFSGIASGNLYNRLKTSNIFPALSDKEILLLKYTPSDMTYKEIADKMGLSERSVAGYRISLFDKFEVNSRAGLAVCAIQMGFVRVE